MLMPTADRRKIYEKIFEDGVAIAKKDYNLKEHPEIKDVKNLYVIKGTQSKSSSSFAGFYYQTYCLFHIFAIGMKEAGNQNNGELKRTALNGC